jgi:hypothetical protein
MLLENSIACNKTLAEGAEKCSFRYKKGWLPCTHYEMDGHPSV